MDFLSTILIALFGIAGVLLLLIFFLMGVYLVIKAVALATDEYQDWGDVVLNAVAGLLSIGGSSLIAWLVLMFLQSSR